MEQSTDSPAGSLSQDEILSATKAVTQGLESLRTEHKQILHSLVDSLATIKKSTDASQFNMADDKAIIIKKSIEAIELGIGEAEVMVALASHLQYTESEKQKLRAQVRRLCQENAWLRDELANTQQRLQLSEQKCATLEEEKSHLQFMNDMKKYDTGDAQVSDDKEADPSSQNLDLGFPEDDDDHPQDGKLFCD